MLRCWTPQGSRKFESFCFRNVGRLAELVDGTGLENRRSWKGLVGSNPTSSAICSGGEAVNVSVRKTDIRGFESLSELKRLFSSTGRASAL